MTEYLTEEIKALVGVRGEPVVAPEPVERGQVRRHAQAIMDDDPLYYDDKVAKQAGYPTTIAPPLFPLHAFRRKSGTPDPLQQATTDPDYDGSGGGGSIGQGLPRVEVPLARLLNGGNEIEIFDSAYVGDLLECQSKYESIEEKVGRSGPLIFIRVLTEYRAKNRDVLLLRSRQTNILR